MWETNVQNKDRSPELSLKYGSIDIVKRAQEEKFVFIVEDIHLRYLIDKYEACDLRIADDKFWKANLGMVTYKNFPFKDMFDQRYVYSDTPDELMFLQVYACLFYC